MHTHSSKTIAAPGLSEMIATLELADIGHPGPGWFSAPELSEQSGTCVTTIKPKLDAGAKRGVYETCRRKVGRSIVTFYRLKGKGPGRCSTRANHEGPVRSFPPALFPRAKKKRAGK